ncbi:hypothetical protein SAMN04489832_0807 [Micromonospora cremea]|uniref:Uncharacterized protein n=1 Tax=Micromonospora cremea TaxID=709881 RepID=A0A1N5UCS3_9ACTN|nr:hypothetical protein SAMN04489832_0807 [Micromonospora cremea]
MVRLLVGPAAASGSLDVVCRNRLGAFFASVIIGNLVRWPCGRHGGGPPGVAVGDWWAVEPVLLVCVAARLVEHGTAWMR